MQPRKFSLLKARLSSTVSCKAIFNVRCQVCKRSGASQNQRALGTEIYIVRTSWNVGRRHRLLFKWEWGLLDDAFLRLSDRPVICCMLLRTGRGSTGA